MLFAKSMRRVARSAAIAFTLSWGAVGAHAQSAIGKVVFFYPKAGNVGSATVRLDRIEPLSEGMRAILAMYAFQNATDCAGPGDGLTCTLTEALNVGGQCSDQHIELVRKWFRSGMPRMSGYSPDYYRDLPPVSKMKDLCYHTPDGATFQQLWDLIRVSITANRVHVYANGMWIARDNAGTFRYETDYEILPDSIRLISHRDISPKRKQQAE